MSDGRQVCKSGHLSDGGKWRLAAIGNQRKRQKSTEFRGLDTIPKALLRSTYLNVPFSILLPDNPDHNMYVIWEWMTRPSKSCSSCWSSSSVSCSICRCCAFEYPRCASSGNCAASHPTPNITCSLYPTTGGSETTVGDWGYINNDDTGWQRNMHRAEINETRAWPVALYKIYRDVTVALQCPWQVTTQQPPIYVHRPLRQTVGHVIVTDCAKNSGNKAVFAPNQTPPLLWWPTMDEGRRITQRPPPIGQRPPPTDTAAIQGSSKGGKWETKLQLSTVALAYMHGKFIKIEDNQRCKSVCQFVSLSLCQPVNPSVRQPFSPQSADECVTRGLKGIKWGRDIQGNCNLASQSARWDKWEENGGKWCNEYISIRAMCEKNSTENERIQRS